MIIAIKLALATLGIAALGIGLTSTSPSDTSSDLEAAELIGGACPFRILLFNCDELTRKVEDPKTGKEKEVQCPTSPFKVRVMVPSENGDTKKGDLINVTCNGCGKFYKRLDCSEPKTPVDPADRT